MARLTSSPLNAVKKLVETIVPWQTWIDEQNKKAGQVALYRKYAEGDHRSGLSEEMRNMLRIKEAEVGSPFNINHLDNIIQTEADRLEVTEIVGDDEGDEGTTWLAKHLRRNKFDGLQGDVAEAALRDGSTYIMVDFPDKGADLTPESGPRLTHEEAFDGISGVVMVYGTDPRTPLMALKLWQEILPGEKKVSTRINAYYPDRLEQYVSKSSNALTPYPNAQEYQMPWVGNNKALGIPIIHFPNRGGRSEIDPAIPVQDALNRNMVSMVMASELTAFQVRWIVGDQPPAGMTPGMWLWSAVKKDGKVVPPNEEQKRWLDSIRYGTLEQGELVPFLAQAEFMIDQMYTITRTPRHNASTDASGESLKQKEIGLVGKVKRAQVNLGNAWEAVAGMMVAVQVAFGKSDPPAVSSWSTTWRSAELRDDTQVVDNALKMAPYVDERTLLSMVASVYGWSSADIDSIQKAKRGDAAARFAGTVGNIPSFAGGALNGIPADDQFVQASPQPEAAA